MVPWLLLKGKNREREERVGDRRREARVKVNLKEGRRRGKSLGEDTKKRQEALCHCLHLQIDVTPPNKQGHK